MDNDILTYFKELLSGYKYDTYKSYKMMDFAEMQEPFVEEIDENKGIIKYLKVFHNPDTDDAIEALATYNFNLEFRLEINNNVRKIISAIDEAVVSISITGQNSTLFLNNLNRELDFLYNKAKINFREFPLVQEGIDNISQYLIERYDVKLIPKIKGDESYMNSFFIIKSEILNWHMEELYIIADDFKIINSEIIDEETFIDVLSRNNEIGNKTIQFNCNNQIAVHFINCIKPLFNDFSFSKIAKSQRFFSKKGTCLKQTNLDTANSLLQSNNSPIISEISEAIESLIDSIGLP